MKIWMSNWNNVLTDVAHSLRDDGHEFVTKFEDTDVVVLWNETLPDAISIANLSKSLGKKVVTVQHGRRGSSKYYPPFNQEIVSDKLLVWGERDKERLIKAGRDSKKIVVTGTTLLSHIKPRKKHKGTNIVFCPEHWDTEVWENDMVAQELRKLKGVKIVTKIIEGHNPKWYDNPVLTNRGDSDHLEILINTLSEADLLVGVSESTTELFAQAMDIPVVIMKDWVPKPFDGHPEYEEYERKISEASKAVSLKDLNSTIMQQLENPDELKEERKKVVELEGGPKDALERIKKEING